MVTLAEPRTAPAAVPFPSVIQWSIVAAVAQWKRCPAIALLAVQRLRNHGIGEAEILARRRAGSNDADLAALLHLAVVLVITGGRVLEDDLRPLARRRLEHHIPTLRTAVTEALALVADAGALDAGAPLDMDVGDY